jgi:hypothetical protein
MASFGSTAPAVRPIKLAGLYTIYANKEIKKGRQPVSDLEYLPILQNKSRKGLLFFGVTFLFLETALIWLAYSQYFPA